MNANPATSSLCENEAANAEQDPSRQCAADAHTPWNPGIKSQLPRALLPLCTVFRPEHVSTTLESALELRDFTGLALHELVAFRPQRLVVHELLVRVTADLSVPDGSHYEDLGINFRRITQTVLDRYIQPHMPEIERAFETLRGRIARAVDAALEQNTGRDRSGTGVESKPDAPRDKLFGFLRRRRAAPEPRAAAPSEHLTNSIERLRTTCRSLRATADSSRRVTA